MDLQELEAHLVHKANSRESGPYVYKTPSQEKKNTITANKRKKKKKYITEMNFILYKYDDADE